MLLVDEELADELLFWEVVLLVDAELAVEIVLIAVKDELPFEEFVLLLDEELAVEDVLIAVTVELLLVDEELAIEDVLIAVKVELLFEDSVLLIGEELAVEDVLIAVEDELLFEMLLVGDTVLFELALAIGLVLYTFKRFGPPQYSDPSPLQVIEHPSDAITEPAFKLFPQKPMQISIPAYNPGDRNTHILDCTQHPSLCSPYKTSSTVRLSLCWRPCSYQTVPDCSSPLCSNSGN